MNTVAGLRARVVGAGLRRLRPRSRPRDAAAALPWHRRHRARDRRRRVGGRHARSGRRRARSCSASSTRLADRGWSRDGRHRARVHRVPATPTRRRGPTGYRDLTPANQYNVDYSILGTSRVEPLLRRIRKDDGRRGHDVESAKGECNLGQHEITFRYDDALATCDNHAIYKTGAKEIAAQEGMQPHVHGQGQRARGQFVPRASQSARRRRHAR